MPSRLSETRCICAQCSRQGGFDASGKPKGVMMPSRHLPAHLARVRAEQDKILEKERENIESRMVALALTDDGPDQTGQPSKLWTSREEFQQAVSPNHRLPDHSASPPINDILESVSRLSISTPRVDHTNVSTIDSAPSATPASALLRNHSHNQSRREKNRRTTAVLQVFDQVDLEIDACNAKLTQTPSVNVLNEVQSALDVLHPRVAQVTRKAPSIDVRKRQICEHLISLDARIAEWKYLLKAKEPISYNSGKDNLSYLPPSWC